MKSFPIGVLALDLFCLAGGSSTAVVFHHEVARANHDATERLSVADAAQFMISAEAAYRRQYGRYVNVGRASVGRPYAATRDGGRAVVIAVAGGSSRIRYLLHADGSISTLR